MRHVTLCLLAALAAAVLAAERPAAAPTRVLFVGNSFTFVNDLPHRLLAVAASKGRQVEVANSTIGGCSLYYLYNTTLTQSLLRESWDFIVLQDYSQLPSVAGARERMMEPAIRAFAAKKGGARLVSYNTWGYYQGAGSSCPGGENAECFPIGTLASFAPNCQSDPNVWGNKVATFDCMSYATSRGYLATLQQGIEMVAPCGEAWQVVRDSANIGSCEGLIDKEYAQPLNNLTLPLHVANKGDTSHIMLYLDQGKDKHPSPAGQYLNALVFYATLFGDSPVGATNMDVPAADAAALQRVAAGVVLDHKQAWGLH